MKMIKHQGKSYVLVAVEAWEALVSGGVAMPPLPAADAEGNVPAVAFARATIARRIIRDRTALGLSQVRLAKMAGIRPETLNRIEKGRVTPDEATALKIEKVLKQTQDAAAVQSIRRVMNRKATLQLRRRRAGGR